MGGLAEILQVQRISEEEDTVQFSEKSVNRKNHCSDQTSLLVTQIPQKSIR